MLIYNDLKNYGKSIDFLVAKIGTKYYINF